MKQQRLKYQSKQILPSLIESQQDYVALAKYLLRHLHLLNYVHGTHLNYIVEFQREICNYSRQVLLLITIEQCEVEHNQIVKLPNQICVLTAIVFQGQLCELVQRGYLQTEVGCSEDETLHFEQLGQSIESIAEIDIFISFKGMDLIVFGSHEKCGHSQKLKVQFTNPSRFKDQHQIDELHTDLHGFLLHLKLFSYLQQPPQQHPSHLRVHLYLTLRVFGQPCCQPGSKDLIGE